MSDSGHPAKADGLSPTVEPVPVSPLRASIPDASAWRTDSPIYGKRPIWQYVFLQGTAYHNDGYWMRSGWGTAGIRTNDADDALLGYRRADIERICKDNDIDLYSVRLVGWLPMTPPALITCENRPALALCDDGEWSAKAIEARMVETERLDQAKHKSAVAKPFAQTLSEGNQP